MKTKVRDRDWPLKKCTTLAETKDLVATVNGWIGTAHGLVKVICWTEIIPPFSNYTRLLFVINKRLYSRDFIGRRYKPRMIVTLARRFVNAVLVKELPF